MYPASSKNFTSSLFEGTLRSSDRLVGSPSRQSVELFQEPHGGFAIWLDPFGVLDWEVVVNLLPELAVGMDLVRHDNWRKIQVWRRTSTGVGAVNAGRDQVRVFQKAARTRLRCALRRANWNTL